MITFIKKGMPLAKRMSRRSQKSAKKKRRSGRRRATRTPRRFRGLDMGSEIRVYSENFRQWVDGTVINSDPPTVEVYDLVNGYKFDIKLKNKVDNEDDPTIQEGSYMLPPPKKWLSLF